jgi:hypothetical protein
MNPNYSELQNDKERYKMLLILKHSDIAKFVGSYLYSKTLLASAYRIFLLVSFLVFITISAYLLFINSNKCLTYLSGFLLGIISFFLLVAPHEIIHGLMYKYFGAKRVKYGVIWSKLAFYAIAPNFVVSKIQFIALAAAPFAVISTIVMTLLLISFGNPFWHFYFWGLFLMHSLGCVGDFAMIAFFELQGKQAVYTFDDEKAGVSYFYLERP